MAVAQRSLSCFLYLLFIVSCVQAYTWKFDKNPTQCTPLTISIDGDDGQAPYNLLLIPYGAAPGRFETRMIQTLTFNASNGRELDFVMNYPSNSQFVAVVSDAKGFGTGGTSAPWTVKGSSDTACFDATRTISLKWPYFYLSTDGLRSCEDTRVYWNSSNPNITGTVNFAGIIPGGESFNITSSPLFDVPNNLTGTTGFNWTVPVNPGTDLILMSGDQGGTGGGGSVSYRVSPPQDAAHTACFPKMPSATPGTPAGGDPSVDPGAKKTNVGAIAGGVVGGVVALAAIGIGIFFCLRSRRQNEAQQFTEKSEIDPHAPLPVQVVTPFQGPPDHPQSPTQSAYTGSNITDHPFNLSPAPKPSMPITPTTQSGVNYVHHTDAEDVSSPRSQVVDLPPAYNPHRTPSSAGGSSHGSRPLGDHKSRPSNGGQDRTSAAGQGHSEGRPSSSRWPYSDE